MSEENPMKKLCTGKEEGHYGLNQMAKRVKG